MDLRTTAINSLIEAHLQLVDARADYQAAAGDFLKLCETDTTRDDRISLPAVFSDTDGETWIIHHAGSGGLTVRPATPYTEGANL